MLRHMASWNNTQAKEKLKVIFIDIIQYLIEYPKIITNNSSNSLHSLFE